MRWEVPFNLSTRLLVERFPAWQCVLIFPLQLEHVFGANVGKTAIQDLRLQQLDLEGEGDLLESEVVVIRALHAHTAVRQTISLHVDGLVS